MAEEFDESEVVFNFCDEVGGGGDFQLNSKEFKRKKMKSVKKQNSTAVPVSIPENVSWLRYDLEDCGGGDGEMVPPHVILGRRVAGKMMAFSVFTGNGRTLKGRDLSQVRNSILRLTGFLET
ncbi:hypothetical protein SASPL_156633 [Salvia splendens]|uniref:Senescence regulator S40 n=1 Tax=Salvia splendens TaxID=180675 RepID=A0A8X8YWT9_SALSN|nr:uncharacterized protein LOC121790403 [Salvia splendens]KAG6383608.1 hypothetical protein SASPL_156633 [Salvia splendens]